MALSFIWAATQMKPNTVSENVKSAEKRVTKGKISNQSLTASQRYARVMELRIRMSQMPEETRDRDQLPSQWVAMETRDCGCIIPETLYCIHTPTPKQVNEIATAIAGVPGESWKDYCRQAEAAWRVFTKDTSVDAL